MNKSNHPLYKSWHEMHRRCTNPNCKNYPTYGARGISVCPEWDDFWQFVEDMGERPEGHTLDRIDNNKGYSPDNCRWATMSEQNFNRRPFNRSRPVNAKGYYFHKPTSKFRAQAKRNGQPIHLGSFDCPLMAHLAYKDYITQN